MTTRDESLTDDATDQAVWKALADPTRRRLLDLLRNQPRTTGDLAKEFSTSRFAVMKHLSVLQTAGLVLVTRRGRERWNQLNPTPLQAVHERWVTPSEAPAASSLLRLKQLAETRATMPRESDSSEKESSMSEQTDKPAQIEIEIVVEAPRARVWEAFVDKIDAWWRPDFRTDARTKRVILEATVGGRLFEDYGDGDGLLWMTVILLKKGERVDLVGHSGPDWGGPNTGYHSFRFTEEGAATRVRLIDHYLGHVSEATRSSLEDGWKLLLADGLKPYVEASQSG